MSEDHVAYGKTSAGRVNVVAFSFVGVLSVLHLYGLWIGDLYPWDGCIYALRARYVLRGFWLDQMPYCYGPPWEGLSGFYSGAFPPLLIWLMAASMKFFGETAFAARLPTALLGTASIWVLYLWGREARNRATGIWAAFILASLFFITHYMRRAQLDVPVTFFILLTTFFGMLYYKRGDLRWLILAGIAMGIGLMAKILVAGFAAVALLLAAVVLWARGEISWKRVVVDQVILNAIGIGLALPWHVFMILKYRSPTGGWIKGNEFLGYFWGYHVGRRMEPVEGKNLAEWHFYIATAWERLRPLWTVLFAVAFAWAVWRIAKWVVAGRTPRGTEEAGGETNQSGWGEAHALLVPTVWLIFVVSFLTLAQHKSKTYLVMMTPPAVLLTAQFLDRIRTDGLALWPRRSFAFGVFYLAIASRVSDHFDHLAAGLYYPPDIPQIAGALAPVVLSAGVVVTVCELIARWVPRLRRLTVLAALATIVAFGFHQGLRKSFERKYFNEEEWSHVRQAVKKGDFDRLVFVGKPDQPDHYYHLDGIPPGWRRDVEYVLIDPARVRDLEPLPAKPRTLVIVETLRLKQAASTKEDVETLLSGYELKHSNDRLMVYRPQVSRSALGSCRLLGRRE